MAGLSSAHSDAGLVRERNEDAIFADDGLGVYAVADGVGGENAGDRASALAIKAIAQAGASLARLVQLADRSDDEAARRAVFDALGGVVDVANNLIFETARAEERARGMMSTLTVVLLGRCAAYVAHVGDSRLYLARDGHMDQITVDHTLAEELIRAGRIQREQLAGFRFRNVLSRALGERATIAPDLLFLDVRPGDTLLLSSDGVHDLVAELDVLRVLQQVRPDHAPALTSLANDHGGTDNSAAVVVQVLASDEPTTAVTSVPATDHTAKLDLLGHLDFCRHLSAEERMKVLRYVHEVIAEHGTTVVRQGEQGQDFYLVVSGTLAVEVDGVVLHTLGAGASFGEIALVSGTPRTASVLAQERSKLFRISRDGFYDLGQKDQAIAVKMLWAFAQSLAHRVTALSQAVVDRQRG